MEQETLDLLHDAVALLQTAEIRADALAASLGNVGLELAAKRADGVGSLISEAREKVRAGTGRAVYEAFTASEQATANMMLGILGATGLFKHEGGST